MLRKEFEKRERDRIAREKREMDPQRQKRESQLVQKITIIDNVKFHSTMHSRKFMIL
jgi:hypothetical protein